MTGEESPRVLAISGTIPGEPGVGGVILKDLADSLPDSVLKFIPIVSQQVIDLGWLDRGTNLEGHLVRRYETGWRPVTGIAGEAISRTARNVKFGKHCRQLVDSICQHKAAQNADLIWAIMDCPTVIEIAKEVSQRLKKPLIILVWDSPELLVKQFNLDRWSAAAMLSRFRDTIRAAQSVGVICEQMQQAYERDIGSNRYVILRHGIQEKLWADSESAPTDRLIIGFAGSITAVRPFHAFVQALNDCGWAIDGKPITLRLIGSRYLLDSRQPQHIEYFGWQSLENTVRLLSECSLQYLPQPFDAALRPLAELSFPTKLTTYLAAGRRVLLHAPKYGSVNSFMQKYPLGTVCNSLEPQAISTALEHLARLSESTVRSAIDQARADEFNRSVFVDRFRELIGFKSPKEPTTATEAVAGKL